MNYLITGGTGLIGSQLINALSAADTVYLLTRNAQSAEKQFQHCAATVIIHIDLNDITNFEQIDAVINLAGEPIADKRWSDKQKHKITHSRWDITEALVTKINASATPPKVFISGSAIGIYGRQDKQQIDESWSSFYPEFSREVCQRWEQLAEQVTTDTTRVCILRTGIVLAKGRGALGKMALPFYFAAGAVMGDGEQGMSWIHLQDMVDGILHLVNHTTASGAFNFTAPSPVSHREFCQTLATTLNRPCWWVLPAPVMRLLLGEMSDLLLYGQYAVPCRLIDSGYQFNYPKLTSALSAVYSK